MLSQGCLTFPTMSRERNWPVHLLTFPLRFSMRSMSHMRFPGISIGKESTCDARDLGLIPGLGKSPGEGHGNPLQYSCLENPQGQRNLVGCSPWDHKELVTTERVRTVSVKRCLRRTVQKRSLCPRWSQWCDHSPGARHPGMWSQVGLRITTNKASGGHGIPVELFQILKDDAVKVLHSICQQIWKTQQWQ